MAPPNRSPGKRGQFKVLITGYGPFGNIKINPSWECISSLHNTVLTTAASSNKIHLTCLGPIRVAYDTILTTIPLLHSRPPSFPALTDILHNRESLEPDIDPPEGGWDLTLHLGAGTNGGVEVEKLGHKTGYSIPDVDGKLPPEVKAAGGQQKEPSNKEKMERQRVGKTASGGVVKGFAGGYGKFPEELRTEVDVDGLVAFLKTKLNDKRFFASADAGHFLCDFLCYGSLAESQRANFEADSDGAGNKKHSLALFMHVPSHVNQPFTVEQLTEVVKQAVSWICTGEGI